MTDTLSLLSAMKRLFADMKGGENKRLLRFFCECSSYRKILNDLSSDVPAVPRIEEEKSEDDSAPAITTVTMPTPIYQTSSGQYSKYFETQIAGVFS